MNETVNYHLPQWDAEDFIKRDDFNRNNEIIDTVLKRLTPVYGSYTGNGATAAQGGLEINLGFRPSVIFVTHGWTSSSEFAVNSMLFIPGMTSEFLQVTENGFRVIERSDNSTIRLNYNNWGYTFIAIP